MNGGYKKGWMEVCRGNMFILKAVIENIVLSGWRYGHSGLYGKEKICSDSSCGQTCVETSSVPALSPHKDTTLVLFVYWSVWNQFAKYTTLNCS